MDAFRLIRGVALLSSVVLGSALGVLEVDVDAEVAAILEAEVDISLSGPTLSRSTLSSFTGISTTAWTRRMSTWRVPFNVNPGWVTGGAVSCMTRCRALRWFSDEGVGSCKTGPGRVRFALEVVLDTEGPDFDGGCSWIRGLKESSAETRCNRVDADKLPMAEYLTTGVYGVPDV